MMDAPREKTFLLAEPEARALTWLAAHTPRRVMPDHLTLLALAAAAGIAAAYAAGGPWLWAAAALLVVHWLGDSLDGSLARHRRHERPRYGYYVDHLCDALATAMIGIGLGLSDHMLLATGLVIVVAYLVLSINTYLETYAFGKFRLGYGVFGPTEARIALLALTVALALGADMSFHVAGLGMSILDVGALTVAAAMLAGLAVRATRNLRELARAEPAGITH
jgi:archaetidylinositol phosphate synthase